MFWSLHLLIPTSLEIEIGSQVWRLMPVDSGDSSQEDGGMRASQEKKKQDPITTNKAGVVVHTFNSS
jgi:hypothetical protein